MKVADRNPILVHGGARGVDLQAARMWERLGGRLEAHPVTASQWQQMPGYAGFKRNEEMVGLGAKICLAFIREDSKGATHCANLAEKAGIRTLRFFDPDKV